jgi:hypothetical protein
LAVRKVKAAFSGSQFITFRLAPGLADLARLYGFTDRDGSRPPRFTVPS